MNKEITEELMVKSVDNLLNTDEKSQLDALLSADPDLVSELEKMRVINSQVRNEIPSSVEPPYADFFNNQLMRKVELDKAARRPKEKAKKWWQGLKWAWAPAGAMALTLAFLAGQRLSPGGDVQGAAVASSNLPSVYFSEDSLGAEIVADADGNVSAIVVSGLTALSDDGNFAGIVSEGEFPVSYQRSEAQEFH
ncbi:hypothetical protein N9Z02_01020 [Akkermansiaceae bacterium]|nr:hypothetical protein [Akkermansiaceae bacterium]